MIKQYRNEEWLRNKYWKEELSSRQIARLCEADQATILNWMKKFNILRRPSGEAAHLRKANHCNLSQKAIEWINGELLGDGCLLSQSPHSAFFTYGSKYLEYAEYIKNTLKLFGIKSGKINKEYHKEIGRHYYRYKSHHYVELLPIRKKWYPNGKKIIPRDIKLSSVTLRQQYIGDGCLSHRKKIKPCINLSTNNFPISNVEWFIRELIRLGFKVSRHRSSNVIRISVYSVKDFLEYIGSCPVECYRYKWAY